MDYLDCLERKHPNIARAITIGKSVEGRALKALKIGRNRANGRENSAIWIDGGIHSREWISPATVEYIIYQLVENSTSRENQNLIENFDFYVQPILNPDG